MTLGDIVGSVVRGEWTLDEARDLFDRAIIEAALVKTNGNRSRAAALIGTSRRMFNYRVSGLGIQQDSVTEYFEQRRRERVEQAQRTPLHAHLQQLECHLLYLIDDLTAISSQLPTDQWPSRLRNFVTSGQLKIDRIPEPEPEMPIEECTPVDIDLLVRKFEWQLICQALRKTNGNRQAAARLLGTRRTTLVAKIRRHYVGRTKRSGAERSGAEQSVAEQSAAKQSDGHEGAVDAGEEGARIHPGSAAA